MDRKIIGVGCSVLAFCFILTSLSFAAEKKQNFGTKAKKFVQKIVEYPAKVMERSVDVVADTGKKGTTVVTEEIKTVGQVATGELGKTKELVTEPITGVAETAVSAVEKTVAVPVEAAKEEAPATAK